MEKRDVGFFDPKADWSIVERGLPHWSQAGCVCFVTWRLHDSLPADSLERIVREVETLLQNEGIDPHGDWKLQIAEKTLKRQGEIQWKLFTTRDRFLDQGFGDCHLADSRCSTIVLDGLGKFDPERYFLTDAVVMPNHAHFLCAFADEDPPVLSHIH